MLEQQKTDVRRKKTESLKNKTAKKQTLEALRKEVQNNPEKQNEVEAMNNEIINIDKEQQAIEAEEKRLNETTPMDVEGDALQSQPEVGDISSTAQAPVSVNQAGGDPNRNNHGQGGGDNINNNINNNQNNDSGNKNSESDGYQTNDSDKEEEEISVMTVADYKRLIGSPTEACKVVAWKPAARVRGKEVINKYGSGKYPKFRIEAASESFDENLPKLTAPGYRIGERKAANGIDWEYDFQNVVGIIAVAIRVRDEKDPLRAIDPAYHTKNQRYTETQVWIQWQNIKGDNPNPTSWEKRGTAQRVCPLRGKGVADKMIFMKAKESEEEFSKRLADSKERDINVSPAPDIKVEKVSGTEKGSYTEPAISTNASQDKEKSAQPAEADPIPMTSPAPVGAEVSATNGTQASRTPPLDRKVWLTNYCEIFDMSIENMSDDDREKMVNAWIKAKANAAASA